LGYVFDSVVTAVLWGMGAAWLFVNYLFDNSDDIFTAMVALGVLNCVVSTVYCLASNSSHGLMMSSAARFAWLEILMERQIRLNRGEIQWGEGDSYEIWDLGFNVPFERPQMANGVENYSQSKLNWCEREVRLKSQEMLSAMNSHIGLYPGGAHIAEFVVLPALAIVPGIFMGCIGYGLAALLDVSGAVALYMMGGLSGLISGTFLGLWRHRQARMLTSIVLSRNDYIAGMDTWGRDGAPHIP